MTTYLIAFTIRSGSTLLCEYLTQNGLGQPTEYFQYPFGEANRWVHEALGVGRNDFPRYLKELQNQYAPNGVFGAKLTWDQRNALVVEAHRHDPTVQDIHDIFPNVKWIYLRRHDKFAQAVSAWRAAKTGRWHALDHTHQNNQPEYDYFGIFRYFFTFLVEEYMWEDYFRRQNCQPATIYYEDLVGNARNTFFSLVESIRGETPLIRNPEELKFNSSLVKMADDYSERIKSNFIEDLYHIGALEYWQQRQSDVQHWQEFFGEERWKGRDR